MSEARSYEGSCHCGRVRFRAALDLTQPATVCNCSICSKTGTMLQFIPASSFELLSGQEALTDYQFAKKHIHHLFCSTCGIRSFAHGAAPDGQTMYAVNLRCLDGVELESVPTRKFDGRSL